MRSEKCKFIECERVIKKYTVVRDEVEQGKAHVANTVWISLPGPTNHSSVGYHIIGIQPQTEVPSLETQGKTEQHIKQKNIREGPAR